MADAETLRAVRQLLREGQHDSAEREAARLLTACPGQVEVAALHASCAAVRGDWQTALQRWEACRGAFANSPTHWRIGLGNALLHTGRLDAAEAEFRAAMQDQPGALEAQAGHAMAVSRLRPAEAELLWRALSRKCTTAPPPAWQAARIRALRDSGATLQANTLLGLALAAAPSYQPLLDLLANDAEISPRECAP